MVNTLTKLTTVLACSTAFTVLFSQNTLAQNVKGDVSAGIKFTFDGEDWKGIIGVAPKVDVDNFGFDVGAGLEFSEDGVKLGGFSFENNDLSQPQLDGNLTLGISEKSTGSSIDFMIEQKEGNFSLGSNFSFPIDDKNTVTGELNFNDGFEVPESGSINWMFDDGTTSFDFNIDFDSSDNDSLSFGSDFTYSDDKFTFEASQENLFSDILSDDIKTDESIFSPSLKFDDGTTLIESNSSIDLKTGEVKSLDGMLKGKIKDSQFKLNVEVDNEGNKTFSGSINDVPEPLTILGSATALGFGALLKREYAKKHKKS